ncbi:nuclear RNA export factor 1/2 [Sporothrix brasiliensis 5110]|uniref:mRNA export factor MEX67 n=1 Tax=Sporothrix brasiliensis 5110 TaxID=1398154 RepID=A0A0C2IJ08_9PEZI|nr:nuclear RNA export factor 1/2 [Sporothrix brasiliensis 5110]KIH86975.1 nuclear RNA export factor 1/2 [Sporothrix brasiliensis 5110]
MAPPTGPRADARTTRSSTRNNTTSGNTGGGIRKRGGAPKTDRNGDVIMGNNPATKTDGRKSSQSTRGGRGGSRAVASAEQKIKRHLGVSGEASLAKRISELPRKKFSNMANRKVFKIVGLQQSKAAGNADRGERGLLDFIERKSANMGRGLKIIKSRLDNDFVLTVMVDQEDAEELMKLNNFVFAGAKLTVAEDPQGWPGQAAPKPKLSQETLERKSQLQQVLATRYDAGAKLLNLSRLGEDPVLIGMGYLEDKDRAEKTFKVLMAICDETFPTADAKRDAVVSVSLANNNIDWVGQVFDLAETFPDIKNLDLSGNQFKQLKSLNRWRGRFRNLETLLMIGSPVETEDPNYKTELMSWFPKLMNLSNVQVRTPEQVAAEEAAKAAARPIPIPQFGSDFRDGSGISETFLTQFIQLYDTDRAQVASIFYDDASQFSLSVTTQTPRDNSTPVLPWAAYLRYSRNLTKITSRSARVQRLVRGAAMIKELWNTLPQTRHPNLTTELHKYIVDCHPLPGIMDPTGQSATGVDGLLLTIHGEFEEIDPTTSKQGKRSFTRTFVLGPATPGGQAAFRVVSDMLSLRAHQPIPDQSSQASSEQDQKQKMISELSKVTNMTPQYSEMCLAEAAWNYDGAVAKFQELRPNLGPEVFMSPMV